MPMFFPYHPPLRAVGTIQFRSAGPSHPLYEAATDRGLRLCYWSPLAQRHIPVYDVAGATILGKAV